MSLECDAVSFIIMKDSNGYVAWLHTNVESVFGLVNEHQRFVHLYCILVIAPFYSLNSELYLLIHYSKHPRKEKVNQVLVFLGQGAIHKRF